MKISSLLLSLLLLLSFAAVVLSKEVQVKGHTCKDGTVVKEHTRQVKDKSEKQPDTIQVKGYTRKDGVVVKGYTRKRAQKASKS